MLQVLIKYQRSNIYIRHVLKPWSHSLWKLSCNCALHSNAPLSIINLHCFFVSCSYYLSTPTDWDLGGCVTSSCIPRAPSVTANNGLSKPSPQGWWLCFIPPCRRLPVGRRWKPPLSRLLYSSRQWHGIALLPPCILDAGHPPFPLFALVIRGRTFWIRQRKCFTGLTATLVH
jgi:hypothetical protein